jgi:hypothetical protein
MIKQIQQSTLSHQFSLRMTGSDTISKEIKRVLPNAADILRPCAEFTDEYKPIYTKKEGGFPGHLVERKKDGQ